MIFERIWRKTKWGIIEAECRGWFLFGIVPLYIKIIER